MDIVESGADHKSRLSPDSYNAVAYRLPQPSSEDSSIKSYIIGYHHQGAIRVKPMVYT